MTSIARSNPLIMTTALSDALYSSERINCVYKYMKNIYFISQSYLARVDEIAKIAADGLVHVKGARRRLNLGNLQGVGTACDAVSDVTESPIRGRSFEFTSLRDNRFPIAERAAEFGANLWRRATTVLFPPVTTKNGQRMTQVVMSHFKNIRVL